MNRTLYELFQKESVLPTDIIPIQIDTVDGVLSKVTVSQLKSFIGNIHILDITSTDEMKKLEIEDMYLDYIAGKSFTLYVVDNITIDSVVSKSYILAELIFSDVDIPTFPTYKIYIKYNTIIDDNETITKKENSITAIVSKNTALVNGNIEYSTKDYTIYKDTYIDTVMDDILSVNDNAVSASKWATERTITLGGDLTGSVSIDGTANVTLTATVVDDSHNHIISNIDGLQSVLDSKVNNSQVLTNVPTGALFTDTIYTHPSTHSADIIVDGTTNKAYTAAEKTKLASISSTGGNETTTTIGTLINSADSKITPIDNDMVALMDSLESNVVKKLSWSNIKATLKTYFDTLYSLTGHSHVISDVEGLQTALDGTADSIYHSINIGDGINSVYTINHNLGTEDVLVSIINISTKKNTLVDYTIVNANTITIDFGSVITVGSYRVIVCTPVSDGGATTFISLNDTPSIYTGNAGKILGVKSDETGIEYIDKQNASKYSINIGDGINSTYTINHNLGTEDVLVSIINISTKKNTLVDYTIVNANTITIDFGSVITVGSYRVIVL